MDIIAIINDTIIKIDTIIQRDHPKILADMAEQLFDNKGNFNGHNEWLSNTQSTIKYKGHDEPNIETGQLKRSMAIPGFLENDDWLDQLAPPAKYSITSNKHTGRSGNRDYKYADKLRKFSDIGKTEQDEQYIEHELGKKLQDEFNA